MALFNSNQELRSKIDAVSRSQAVIEFNLDGTIVTANENFLGAIGYRLDEVQGKHHSMFVPEAERSSAEYREFWNRLRAVPGARVQAHRERRTHDLDSGLL